MLVELGRGPHRTDVALRVQRAHDVLDDEGLGWQRPSRTLAAGIRDVPPRGDEAEEAAGEAELVLDGVVREVVEGEESTALAGLALPRHGAVGARATQRRGTVAVLLDADGELGHESGTSHGARAAPRGRRYVIRDGRCRAACNLGDTMLVSPCRTLWGSCPTSRSLRWVTARSSSASAPR